MQSSHPYILIVDDDRAAALLLETYLARFGFEILSAADADEALSTLAKRSVQAVVSDYNMPGTNGLELTALIKQQYPQIPVFIISGSLRPPEAATAPIEGWFMKGEPISVLRDALVQRLGKHRPHHSPNKPTNPSDLCTCGHVGAYHGEQGCEVIKRFGMASREKCPCSGFVLTKIVVDGNTK